MKLLKYPIFALILLIASCSGSDENAINVIEKNFEEEVPLAGNLIFTFDKSLISDTLVNYWDTTEYIKFDPYIEGRYIWRSSSELEFSPLNYLLPSTEYSAEFTDELASHTENLSLGEGTSFKFHTPYIQTTDAKGYWAISSNNPSEAFLHFDVTFNYQVRATEAADHITVKIDGAPQEFKLITEGIGETVSLYLPGQKVEDKETNAELTVSSGLTPINGTLPTKAAVTEEIYIPSPYKLSIYEINSEHDGAFGRIIVSTSQQVNATNIKDYITVTPSVKYSVETDNQSFTLKSDEFDVKQKYDVTIHEGLKGELGGKLKYEYSQQVSFGKLRPSIKFQDQKSVYLSGRGSRDIQVSIINVPKVKVKVVKIYENNILNFIGGGYYDYYYDDYDDYYDDYYGDGYDYYRAEQLGDVVWEQEYESKELERLGNSRLLKLDFNDKLNDYNGIYVVQVSSEDDYWLRANKLVSISDIGLIVKEGKESITVFANSIKTAQPLSGVKLTFVGTNNQVATTMTTDGNGVAVYQSGELLAPGFKTMLVTAELEGDYNYLPFSRTRINTSRFDVGGKRENSAGIEAFIYGDRDIYRPGETINISAILRNYDWTTPDPIPVKLKLLTPNGKEYKTVRKTLNKHGSFETSINVPPTALTGSYTAQLFTSNNVLLNSKRIAVEEFIPDRIKVDVKLSKDEVKSGESVDVNVNAMNFFGPPATNRNYEVEMSLMRKSFYAKDYRDYNFSIENNSTYFNKTLRKGKTDEGGNATETFDIPHRYDHMGILQADFFTTVFDETGRPVNRRNSVDIYTQDAFYGIKYGSYYNRTGQQIKVPIIAVNKEGKALNNVEAHVLLIKHEYKTVLTKSGSYFRYQSEHEEKVLENKVIKLSGSGSYFKFTPELSGKYEIRISAPGVNTFVRQRFYAYGYGRTSYSSFKVNNEGEIDIEFDKENYMVGDKAKVILKTPFSGKVLVTVESNKVIEHFYVETDKRAATFELDVKDAHVPNVYVTATLFRPHEKSELPLTVAHGFAPMLVENPANKLPLTITSAKTSRSRTKQTIKVKAEPNSAITVAVVDEGILQITGFQTPDPYAFFYQKRALEVNSYDVYPYLFPELGINSSTGGDGMNLAKRTNPLTNKRVKLVAFWSGILETNSNGEATYEIDIPQFSGELRVMAVGYKGKAFASDEAHMTIADPIVISTALPRFFSPKDTVDVPVMVSNTTGKDASCKTNLEVSGNVTILGSKSKTVKVKANSEQQVLYKVVAKPAIGQANIKVTVKGLGETFVNETDITVRPASPLQKINGSGTVKANNSKKITMDVGSFIPSSVDNKLMISKSPVVEFTDDLDYLVRYPYGCIEQTVSKAFPQLYLQDLVKDILRKDDPNANPNYNVQEAIKRLKLSQLYNGGMTYWPGHGKAHWWGTIYATHFLIEAKKAGFEVDQSLLDESIKFIQMKLKNKELIEYYYNGSMNRKIAPKEVPYSLYVLALANKADISTMNYYKANVDYLSLDGKYLLAAAYALAGDKTKFKQVIPPAFSGEKSNSTFGGSFYSYVRDEAIALSALVEVDPDNQQIGIMAKHVSEHLKQRRWLNTQERSFSLLALGKIAREAEKSDIKATVKVNGKTIATFNNKPITLNTKDLKGTKVEIETSGTGKLYYFWEAEGISADGSYKEEDSFIRVRKTFYDRYGKQVSNNTFHQNDLIVVKLSIEGATNTYVENVVISDILPAGFEIENSRITETTTFNWIRDRSRPDYEDIRDDRINMFVNVSGTQRNYYYTVRAVSRGKFQMGPVGADAMYNAEYHSYHGGGTIRVLPQE